MAEFHGNTPTCCIYYSWVVQCRSNGMTGWHKLVSCFVNKSEVYCLQSTFFMKYFFFMFESSTSNDEYWVVTTPWSLANRISVCCVTVFIHPPVCMIVGSESLLDDTEFRFCCKMQFYADSGKKNERKKKRKRFTTCTSLTFTWWKWINVFFTPTPSTWIWKWAKVHVPTGEQK